MSDLDAYHIKLIKKGLRAAEEGKFVSDSEMKELIARMGRRKKGSSRNVRKALKILARAGKEESPRLATSCLDSMSFRT